MDIVIGIDLGTTNSCASYFIDGYIKVLENSEGSRITPSFVYFTEQGGVIVGEHAKGMADIMPQNGVYEIKRLIGKKYDDDANIEKSLKNWPFTVTFPSNEKPVVIIEHKTTKTKTEITPIEITTYILRKIKTDVEAKLGRPIKKAVITVPAYFNTSQRKDTLTAAENAGLTVLKLLNEPTAAALIYYFDNKNCEVGDHCLVYDLGGGTLDVAILKRIENKVETIAVDGDTCLGGHDFDNSIITYLSEQLVKSYKYNPEKDRRALRRLHKQCEQAKKFLSTAEETAIVLEGFVQGHSIVDIRLKRTDFENLNHLLFKKTIDIVERCITKANLSKSAIKEVILAGGSTRIPIIQKMLSEYFHNRILNKFIHPDECVAEGAAIQAAMLSKNSTQQINSIQITDVTPLSLGVTDFVDRMAFVIKKNTTIPTSSTVSRCTVYDQQTSMLLNIFEGERLEGKKNFSLGSLEITDITPAPPGDCHVDFTMSIDESGILIATAKEKLRNNVKSLKVAYTKGHRSDDEIQSALVDAVENIEEDEKFKQIAEDKAYLMNYCIKAKYNLKNKELINTYPEAYGKCEEIIKLMKNMNVNDKNIISKNTDIIKKICQPLVEKHKFNMTL